MNLKRPRNLFIGLVLLGHAVFAQDIEEQIFGEASALLATADSAQAALLSPRNYQRGLADYERARQEFEQGGNLERIGTRLADASAHFEAAIEAARLARVSLEPAIKARELAAAAEASRLLAADWETAEQQFSRAARALEKGDLKAAQQLGEAARLGYAGVELKAIKARFLNGTRRLLAEADQARADRHAPATIGKSRALLARAEAALEQNRYETDAPASLAAEASYEARHAIYIAAIAQQVDKGQLSVEDVVLRSEAALADVARTAEVEADFSAGFRNSVDRINAELTRLQQTERDLAERDRQVVALEEELWELDQRLGGATAEREALVMRLEEQARVREQFAQVEGTFEPEEANVLRDGDTLILRLVGLTFSSGSARLDAGVGPLMDKVRAAIGVFPRCELAVEGHTDSSGASQQNLRLSELRAQAVMQYMIENMGIAAYRIKAVGFGDSRPIANNGTAAGRALNRRIDLLIMPKLTR